MEKLSVLRRFGGSNILKIMLLLLCALAVNTSRSNEKHVPSLEYRIKATYVLKFISYIELNPTMFSNANTPWTVGVVGDPEFGALLEDMADHLVINGRGVLVKHFAKLSEVREVHIVYVSMSEMDNLKANSLSKSVPGAMTIGEFENPDIMINFLIDDNKLRFAVNLETAENAGIKFSSKLLSAAKTIHKRRT